MMKQTTKIIVIGGGIAGLATAYYLVKAGATVTIIEKGLCGRQTTWAAAGMLAPIHELEYQEIALLQAGRASLDLYLSEWVHTLPPFGLERHGTLEVALLAEDVPYLERHYNFIISQGLHAEWLNSSALVAAEPSLNPNLPAAIFCPEDIQVDNRLLVQSLMQYLQSSGVIIQENTIVNAIEPFGNALNVITQDAVYSTEKVVITNGYTPQNTLPQPTTIIPIKGQMLALNYGGEGRTIQKTIRLRSRSYGNGYIVPKSNRLIIGSSQEEMGDDASLTAGKVMDILKKAYYTLPAIYDLSIQEMWTGFRPATHTRTPIIDFLPGYDNKVVWVNGLFRNGILLAPLVGAAASQLITQGSYHPKAETFRLAE